MLIKAFVRLQTFSYLHTATEKQHKESSPSLGRDVLTHHTVARNYPHNSSSASALQKKQQQLVTSKATLPHSHTHGASPRGSHSTEQKTAFSTSLSSISLSLLTNVSHLYT